MELFLNLIEKTNGIQSYQIKRHTFNKPLSFLNLLPIQTEYINEQACIEYIVCVVSWFHFNFHFQRTGRYKYLFVFRPNQYRTGAKDNSNLLIYNYALALQRASDDICGTNLTRTHVVYVNYVRVHDRFVSREIAVGFE